MSGVHTDPRTKIFVLLICAVAITISPSLYYEGGLVLLIFIYGIASGKPKYNNSIGLWSVDWYCGFKQFVSYRGLAAHVYNFF